MPRTCSDTARIFLLPALSLLIATASTARADLIRATPGRSFPDIAGDIGGSQTYVYDPATRTGTFALVNAPHLISLGPSGKDLIPLQPDWDGTLNQTLELKLDSAGRLIDSPMNRFEIRGTVTINDRVYEGLLLKGRPTAFGIAAHEHPATKDPEVFGLNMQIEGGKLAGAFGAEAYLRIIPQANNTFSGEFNRDFSGEKPMTNLVAVERHLSSRLLGPASLIGLIATGSLLLAWRIARSPARSTRRSPILHHHSMEKWAATTW